jgi:hypothetical protein
MYSEIKNIPPRQGERLNPVDEEGKPLNPKLTKEEEAELEAKEKESTEQKSEKKKV